MFDRYFDLFYLLNLVNETKMHIKLFLLISKNLAKMVRKIFNRELASRSRYYKLLFGDIYLVLYLIVTLIATRWRLATIQSAVCLYFAKKLTKLLQDAI